MLITRTSLFSGVTRTVDLPVTADQIDRWAQGEMIQNAMPNLSADEREFLMTGATPAEWDSIFPPEDGE